MRTIAISLVFLITSLQALGAETYTSERLLGEILDRSWISKFRDHKLEMYSSHDRTGGARDYRNVLRREGDSFVLVDTQGPGAVVRVWSANADRSGELEITLDHGRPFRIAFAKYFRLGPQGISGYQSGGFYSYLPVVFEEHCKIVLHAPAGDLYHQIEVLKFEKGAKAITSDLNSTGHATPPLPPPSMQMISVSGLGELELEDSQVGKWGAKIRKIKIKSMNPEAWIRIRFDNATEPQVFVPLRQFVGSLGPQPHFTSGFTEWSEDGLSITFPMPFQNFAHIEVVDPSTLRVDKRASIHLEYEALSPANRFNPIAEGKFHAKFTKVTTQKRVPISWLNLVGQRGHLIGVSQLMEGIPGNFDFLEGDEQIAVDGVQMKPGKLPGTQTAPRNGTGTEDYFNAGWYFKDGPFHSIFHGASVVDKVNARVHAYRFHVYDAVRFNHSIQAQMEHGSTNDTNGIKYSTIVYWYSSKLR